LSDITLFFLSFFCVIIECYMTCKMGESNNGDCIPQVSLLLMNAYPVHSLTVYATHSKVLCVT
jgi:hypothetical protein